MGLQAERHASAIWEGDLLTGGGSFQVGSRAAPRLPVTWKARTSSDDPLTSPEELIAAAHASCYSMALSHGLASAGHTPERVATEATVTFAEQEGGGWKISASHLKVRAKVRGLDRAAFLKAAQEAKDGCPVSGALRGNLEITLDADLEETELGGS
jgi:osmotically inducible protein OsmC